MESTQQARRFIAFSQRFSVKTRHKSQRGRPQGSLRESQESKGRPSPEKATSRKAPATGESTTEGLPLGRIGDRRSANFLEEQISNRKDFLSRKNRRPGTESRPNRRGWGPKAAFPEERGTSGHPNRRGRKPSSLAPESNPASASSLKSDPTQAVQPGPPHPLSQSRPHPHRRVRRAALPQPSCPVPSQPTVRHLARRQARLRRRPRCAPS